MKFSRKIIFILLIIISLSCSREKTDDSQKNRIDSLSKAKEEMDLELKKLNKEVDSLEKHLDSLKTIMVDTSK